MLSVDNQQLAWMPSTLGAGTPAASAATQPQAQELALKAPEEDADDGAFSFFGDDGLSFFDLVDVVNPLQHIPFVSTFYRETTGDEIAAAPRAMGATLYFGAFGLVGAVANVLVEESTGKDIGEHMAGWMGNDDPVQTAQNAGTGIGTDNGAGDADAPTDPVLSWARGEADWIKRNATARAPADKPAATPRTAPAAFDTVPDAAPLLREFSPSPQSPKAPQSPPATPAPSGPPERPDVLAEMAILNNDLRAAARAYEVAANLRPAG